MRGAFGAVSNRARSIFAQVTRGKPLSQSQTTNQAIRRDVQHNASRSCANANLTARVGIVMAMICAGVFSAPAFAKPASKVAAGAERIYVHTAKTGDTFLKLAARYLIDPKKWAVLAKYNPTVNPAKIPIGHAIQIPVAAMRAEAAGPTVLSVRGQADVNGAKLTAGQKLNERDKLNTGDDGFVTIQLADGSTLTVQSKSAIELERTRLLANTRVGESVVKLEHGRLETSVTQQNRAARYEVRTPTSNMGVRGTVFRAASDASGKKALSEVIEGSVGVAAGNEAPAGGLALPAGFGSVVEDGRAPSEPIKLLPAPVLPPIAGAQLRPAIVVSFPAVDGAKAYRAQVALDKTFRQLIGETLFVKPVVEFSDLPDGDLQIRVRAIDAAGLEGLDAATPVTIAARPLPPKLNSPLAGGQVSVGETRFGWDASVGASAYRLQLAANDTFTPLLVDQSAIATTSHVVNMTFGSSRFFWRVAAIGADGKPRAFSEARAVHVRSSKLKITPVVVGNLSQLKWRGGNDQTYQYEVARRENFADILQTRLTRESTLLLEGLSKGAYFVRIRVVGPASTPGDIQDAGEWSDPQAIEIFSTMF